ncbi:NUDIX domain-containing protein [Colletotrichum scovillei]|uniref:NUDIX domain-containing protein n=1 Tax=Colletotrichum scovillei TaxID=1209932 RepID=UPI0015C3F7C4|nr:NUDIX domain-containing protein [Colletotrichum scovillei]KAF4779363.1 NUDIX domain-containing protein [Colletotrichum scovillei]
MDESKNETGKVGGVYTYFQSLTNLIPRRAKSLICGCVDDIILHSITSIFIKPFMSYVFLTTVVLVSIAGIAHHPLLFAFFSILTYANQHIVDMVITGLVKSASAIWVDAAVLWFIMSVHFFRERRRRLPRREWIARWDVITLGINAVVYLAPWAPQQDFVYVSASTTAPEDDGFRLTWGYYASLLLVLGQIEGAFAENIWQTRLDAQRTPKDRKYECLRRVWYGFRFWGWVVSNRAMIYLCNMAAWDAVVELVVWEYVPVAYGGLAYFGMIVGMLTFVVLWALDRWKAMWGVRVGSKGRGRDKGDDEEDDDEDDESDDDESDSEGDDSDGDEREEDYNEEDVDVEDHEAHDFSDGEE